VAAQPPHPTCIAQLQAAISITVPSAQLTQPARHLTHSFFSLFGSTLRNTSWSIPAFIEPMQLTMVLDNIPLFILSQSLLACSLKPWLNLRQ